MQHERARSALLALDQRIAATQEADALPAPNAPQHQLPYLRTVINVYLDRLPEAHSLALQWLHDCGPADAMSHAITAAVLAMVEVQQGLLGPARSHLELADVVIQRTASPWGRAWVAIVWAFLYSAQAQVLAADRVLAAARHQARQALGEGALVVTAIDFVHAHVLLDLGRTEQARMSAARGCAAAAQHGIASSAEMGLAACIALWSGRDDEAFAPRDSDRLSAVYPARVARGATASRVRRYLQLGRLQDALALSRQGDALHGRTIAGAAPSLSQLSGDALLAPLEMQAAQGHADSVLRQLEPLLATAQTRGLVRNYVELQLLAAELYVRRQQMSRASARLALAISAASPGRLVQPFLIRGARLAPLLIPEATRVPGLVHPQELQFLEHLRTVCTSSAAPQAELAAPGGATVADTPSARELELLSLLNLGLTNLQLADRLGLSLATVKWHLRNVYAKLGVGTRSAALAKARALHLLPR